MKNNKDISPLEQLYKAFKTVIKDWGIFEVVVFIIFIPISWIYLALRIFQELP